MMIINPYDDSPHGFRPLFDFFLKKLNVFGWDLEWRYDSARKSFYSGDQIIRRVRALAANNKTFMHGQVIILCHDLMLQDE